MLTSTAAAHHVRLAAALHGARRAADERKADSAYHRVHRDGVALQRALLLPALHSSDATCLSELTDDGGRHKAPFVCSCGVSFLI